MRIRIAVASPEYPASLSEALRSIAGLSRQAAAEGAAIVCFPETFLPGYPVGFSPERVSRDQLEAALSEVQGIARAAGIAIIIPMDWYEGERILNVAQVVSKTGEALGYQTKNQLDPSEDAVWTPGTHRRIFELNGLRFGIVICHEGFRYPESVRWAARQGAQVVFHPYLTGGFEGSYIPTDWGSMDSPYYEKAQMVRALENTIYFAASNYTFPYPESASAIIDPTGACIARQTYTEPGVTVAEIDTEKATGLLARRMKPEVYGAAIEQA